jgi:hypothetical protein
VRRFLITSGTSVALALLCAAAAGANTTKAIWGPSSLDANNAACPTTDPCSAFPTYRELGVDVYQFQLWFHQIAPTPPADPRNPNDPAYEWPASVDAIVSEAAANGIRPAALIQFSPPWANGGRSLVWAPDPTAFANFAYAASRRYPSIKLWIIWGEPMLGFNFQPMPPNSKLGPRTYGTILDKTYVALKQASPQNLVTGGSTVTQQPIGFGGSPVTFIKGMRLKNGRLPRMDLLSHNPFEARFPNLKKTPLVRGLGGLSDIDTLHKGLLKIYGKRGKENLQGTKAGVPRKRKRIKVPKLWLSEYTVVSDQRQFGGFFITREEQARWLSAAYAIAGSQKYVAGMGWFTLLDQPEGPGSGNHGLMQRDGVKKPSFFAYAAVP